MKHSSVRRKTHTKRRFLAIVLAIMLPLMNWVGYLNGWFAVSAADENSVTVSILGGIGWKDEAGDNSQNYDFSLLTRPTSADIDQISLYTYQAEDIEAAEAVTLQDKDATRPNYIEYRITEGENLWTYQITNVEQKEGYSFYVQAKEESHYSKPDLVQIKKEEGNAIEMNEIPMELSFGQLTIHNDLRSSDGDATTFTYQVKIGSSEETITTAYKKITGAQGGQDKTVQIPVGLAYKVIEDASSYTTKYDENQSGVMVKDGVTTVVTNLLNNTQVSLVKIWNDNNSSTRMTTDQWVQKMKLFFTVNGDAKELTEDNKDLIGITGTISTQVVKNNTGNWTLYYKIGDSKIFPSFTDAGDVITYEIKEEPIAGYTASYTADGDLMNTKTTDFSANIVWSDASSKETTRPEKVQIKLYRYENRNYQGPEVDTLVRTDDVEGSVDSKQWNYSVSDLPLYSEEGDLYTYYAVQTPIEGGVYTTRYENSIGSQGVITTECYSGGTIKNTMEADTTFSITVKWNDVGSDPSGRPDNAYAYLYRYPVNKGITDAAPVVFKLADKSSAVLAKLIPTDTAIVNLNFEEELTAIGQKLQKFDEDGNRYIYFVKEVKAGTDYAKTYDNSQVDLVAIGVPEDAWIATSTVGAFDGGIINNTKNEDFDYPIEKTWKIGAFQDANVNMSVHMRLERKSGEGSWQQVPGYGDVVLSGFSAEVLTKYATARVARYDEAGQLYSYRTLETKVVENKPITGPDGEISYERSEYVPDVDGRYTTSDGLTFEFDNGINRLVDEFDLTVRKVWSPIPDDYDNSSVKVELYRQSEGSAKELVPNSLITLTPENESDGENSAWVYVYENLSRYDEDGYEYTYQVKEVSFTCGDEGYASSISYSNNNTVATIYNSKGGTMKEIPVSKIWSDDGDTMYREPVTVRLYDENDQFIEGKEIVLSKDTNWEGRFQVEKDLDVSHYYAKEYKVGDHLVQYGTTTIEGYTGENLVATDQHIYQVTNTCTNTTNNGNTNLSCKITNKRVGYSSAKVTKHWVDGSLADDLRPEVSVVLNNDAGIATTTVSLNENATKDGNTWTYLFSGLEKYDSNGKVIHYTVSETVPEETEYISEAEETGYTVGENLHTGDLREYTITNTREAKTDYTVHVKWKDASNQSVRPDVYVELYYQIGDGPILKYTKSSDAVSNHVWVGEVDYLWRASSNADKALYDSYCTISDLNKYAADGSIIHYYTSQTMNIRGDYQTYYYEDSDLIIPSTAVNFAPDDGYILNKLESNVIINGIKLWKNLQTGANVAALPEIEIKLYRYIIEPEDLTEEYYVASTHLEEGNETFKFVSNQNGVPNLDKYNENGEMYTYVVVEIMSDKMLRVYSSGANVFTLTNTFKTDEGNSRNIYVNKQWTGLEGFIAPTNGQLRFPIVTFDLYRVKYSDSFTDALTPYRTLTINPEANSEIGYTTSRGFTNLLIWDEEGEQYKYAIKERPSAGYTTDTEFNVITDSEFSTHTDAHDVTVSFTNEYIPATTNLISIKGTKSWMDKNLESLRPSDTSSVVLHVKRSTYSQTGVQNAISTVELVEDSDYTIAWVKGTIANGDDNKWYYTITGPAIKQYAPNGMAYRYTIEEDEVTHYNRVNGGVVSQKTTATSGVIQMNTLENKLKASYKVTKIWEDNKNKYGLRPTYVYVKLQRKIAEGDWVDVPHVAGDGFDLYSTVGGPVKWKLSYGLNKWMYTFNNLADKDAEGNEFTYRAVECEIGNDADNGATGSQITGDYTQAGPYKVTYDTSVAGVTAITNTLKSTKLTVVKNWADDSNKYDSRPMINDVPQITVKVQVATGASEPDPSDDSSYTDLLDASGNPVSLTMKGYDDTLSASFTDLPTCNLAGTKYYYRAVEVKDAIQNYTDTYAYSSDANGFTTTITNTLIHHNETETIYAKKVWKNGVGTGKTGEKATFELLRYVNGTKVDYATPMILELDGTVDVLDATESGEYEAWGVKWSHLPLDDINGNVITYKVVEISKPSNYLTNTVYDGTTKTFTITNTEITALQVFKTWVDSDNRYETRPGAVQVKLQRRIKDEGTFVDVAAGDLKTDQASTGVVVKTLTKGASASAAWTASFTNLPKYNAENKEFEYQAIEATNLHGAYTVAEPDNSYNSTTGKWETRLTNTLVTNSVKVTKIWDDKNNQDGYRTDNIEVELYHDGSKYSTSVKQTLSQANTWTYTFENLPVYKVTDGTKIKYSVKETITGTTYANLGSKYTQTYSPTEGTIDTPLELTVTNTHVVETKNITVTKNWTPLTGWQAKEEKFSQIQVQLKASYADGNGDTITKYVDAAGHFTDTKSSATYTTITPDADNVWSYTFSNLPVNWNASFTETPYSKGVASVITYSVEEVTDLNGAYISSVSGFNITNSLVTTSLLVTKTWEDHSNEYESRPSQITVRLQRKTGVNAYEDVSYQENGNTNYVEQLMTGTGDTWTKEFTNLPLYDKDGNQYSYRVREITDLHGAYTAQDTVTGNSELESIWDNDTSAYSQGITNELVEKQVKVSKVWTDNDNRDGLRTNSVNVELKHDGNSYSPKKTITLSTDNHFTTTQALPKYTLAGVEINYSVVESSVPNGYTVSYNVVKETDPVTADHIYVTNTHTSETVSKSVKKTWAGDSNYTSSSRPDYIKVYLQMKYQNASNETVTAYVNSDGTPSATVTDFSTMTLNSTNYWTGEWNNLYKNSNVTGSNSTPIQYIVSEQQINGYEQSSNTENNGTFEIVNTLVGTTYKARKIWTDFENGYSTRPDSVVYCLQQKLTNSESFNELDRITKTELSTSMDIDFIGLPTCDQNGDTYEYRVVEAAVGGYSAKYVKNPDGLTGVDLLITNNLTTMTVSGQVGFEDYEDKYDYRPDIVLLEVCDQDTNQPITPVPALTDGQPGIDNNWSYTFTGLPKYKADGVTLRNYYVRLKEEVTSYTLDIPESGKATGERNADNNIINADFTLSLKQLSIKGSKTWVDESNKYHTRPLSADFDLEVYTSVDGGTTYNKMNPSPSVIWCHTEEDTWQFTINSLPRGDAEGNLITYKVKEIMPQWYESGTTEIVGNLPDGSTEITGVDFTNTVKTGGLVVEKQRNGGSDSTFVFKVRLYHQDHVGVTTEELGFYKDSYKVYDKDADLTPDNALRTDTAANEEIRIKAGEKFYIENLPEGVSYEVVEVPEKEETEYSVERTGDYQSTIEADTIKSATVINTATPKIGIKNNTVNYGKDYSADNRPTNAGGLVSVNIPGLSYPNHFNEDYFVEGQLGVAWVPAVNWVDSNKFVLTYVEFGETTPHSITVENYLNEEKSLITNKDHVVYDELRERFPDFTIEQNNGVIVLTLTADADEMPATVMIDIQFIPTLAVLNLTAKGEGGNVTVENGIESNLSDGVPSVDGHSRYEEKRVYGLASEGYQIDSDKILLGIPNAFGKKKEIAGSYSTIPGKEGHFSADINAAIAGKMERVTVEGELTYTRDKDGNPLAVTITVDDMKIPLDVGINFEGIEKENPPAPDDPKEDPEEPTKPDQPTEEPTEPENPDSPKTNDDFPVAWVLTLAGLSLVGIITTVCVRRKSKRK